MPATPIQSLPYPATGDTVDVPRDVRALAEKLDPLGYAPVGAMMMWPTAVAPVGWLICDNTVRLAVDYPALAAVLGTTGGNINMPDMRDHFAIGAGAVALGVEAGANQVALTAAQSGLPAHNTNNANVNHSHSFTTGAAGDHAHTSTTPGFNFVVTNASVVADLPVNLAPGSGLVALRAANSNTVGNTPMTSSGNHQHAGGTDAADPAHAHAVAAANAVSAHENRPLCRAVNYIIRAV